MEPARNRVGDHGYQESLASLAITSRCLKNVFPLDQQVVAEAELNKRLAADPALTSVRSQCFVNQVNKLTEAKSRQQRVKIDQLLTEREKEKISEIYCEFNIDFSEGTDNDGHYLARACRRLDQLLIFKNMNIDPTISKPINGYTSVIKDFGGNPITHINGKHIAVHTCMPLLNQMDTVRHCEFFSRLKSYDYKVKDSVTIALLNAYTRYDPKYMCLNRSENCHVKAQKCFGLHSAYDMSIKKICQAMLAANATEYVGCFIYTNDILYYESGKTPVLEMNYRRFKRNGETYIRFWFDNDPQNGYEHLFDNYIDKLITNRVSIKDSKGVLHHYVTTGLYSKGDTYFFKIYKNICGDIPRTMIFKVLNVPSLNDNFIIYYWQWDTMAFDNHMKPLRLVVPKTLFEKLYSYAMTLADGKFTIKNLLIAANTFNTREIISGTGAKKYAQMNAVDLQHFCHAITMIIFINSYECSQAFSAVKNSEEKVRKGKRTFALFSDHNSKTQSRLRHLSVKEVVRNSMHGRLEADLEYCPMKSLWKKILDLIFVYEKREYEVYLEKMPKVVEIQEELEALYADVEYVNRGFEKAHISDYLMKKDVEDVECKFFDAAEQPYSMASFEEIDDYHKYEKVENSSRGDCIYQSCVDVGIAASIDTMVDRLKDSMFFNSIETGKTLKEKLLTDRKFPDITIFLLIALEFEVGIVLQMHDRTIKFTKKGFSRVYYFLIENSHCTALRRLEVLPELITKQLEFKAAKDKLSSPYSLETRDSAIEKIFTQMKNLRTVAGKFNKKLYDKSLFHCKKLYDPYSFLSNGEYISRSGLKTAEIIHRYVDINIMFALSLGGPGGEVQALHDRTNAFVFGVTKTADSQILNFHPQLCETRFCQLYGSNYDGDITVKENLSSIREEIFQKSPEGVQFVGGDLAATDKDDGCIDYERNSELFLYSAVLAISVLAEGGFAYFKVFELVSETNKLVLGYLHSSFEHVRVVKLLTSRPGSTEMHIICMGFKVVNRQFRVELFERKELLQRELNFEEVQTIFDKSIVYNLNTFLKLFTTYDENVLRDNKTVNDEDRPLVRDYLCCKNPINENPGGIFRSIIRLFSSVPKEFSDLDEFDRVKPVTNNTLSLRELQELTTSASINLVEEKQEIVTAPEIFSDPCAPEISLNREQHSFVSDELLKTLSKKENLSVTKPIIDVTNPNLQVKINEVEVAEEATGPVCYKVTPKVIDGVPLPDSFGEMEKEEEFFDTVEKPAEKGFLSRFFSLNSFKKKQTKKFIPGHGFGIDEVALPNISPFDLATGVPIQNVEEASVEEKVGSINRSDVKILDKDKCAKAIKEYKAYLNKVVEIETSKAKEFYIKSNACPDQGAFLNSQFSNYGLRTVDHWIVQPKVMKPEYLKVIDVKDEPRIIPYANMVQNRHYIVCDYCEKGLDIDILNSISRVNLDLGVIPDDISIVQAAPGTGKTFFIINNNDNCYNTILSTNEGQADFLKRYKKTYSSKNLAEEELSKNFRTMASYLINSSKIEHSEVLYVDEALMHHPGAIFCAALLTPGVKKVVLVGDVLQIPFVNRIPDYKLNYPRISDLVPVSKVLHTSYRCPVDIAFRLDPLYRKYNSKYGFDIGMNSTVQIFNSCRTQKIETIKNVPNDDSVQYLTFTQGEKQELLNGGFVNVSTVHEFQGKENDKIAVVRLNRIPGSDIFRRQEYALVALTRHRRSLIYYTVLDSSDDQLYSMINMTRPTRPELMKRLVMNVGSVDTIKIPSHMLDYRTFKRTPLDSKSITSWYMEFVPRVGNYKHQRRKKSYRIEKYHLDEGTKTIFLVSSDHFTQNPSITTIRRNLIELNLVKILSGFVIDSWIFNFITPTILSQNIYKISQSQVTVCGNRDNYEVIEPGVFELINANTCLEFSPYDYEAIDEVYLPLDVVYNPNYSSIPCSLEIVQDFISTHFGENAYIDQSLDSWMKETSDINLHLSNVRYSQIRAVQKHRTFDCMTPLLKTPIPHLRSVTYREILLAFQKRNGGVPQMVGHVDVDKVSDTMVERLIKRCFDEEMVLEFEQEPIVVTSCVVHQWLQTQKPNVAEQIAVAEAMQNLPLNQYNFSIKRTAKPDLTPDAATAYLALQTIVYHDKNINAYFCSIFRQLKSRILKSLKKHVKFFCDCSVLDFLKILDRDFGSDIFSRLTFILVSGDDSYLQNLLGSLEIDISKFDKSQWYLDLLYECKWMSRFGVNAFDINLWFYAHILTNLYDFNSKFSADVYYQRKSGDASTYLGNTMKTLGSIAYYIPIDDMEYFDLSQVDLATEFPLMFNLELKIFKYKSAYFCSKFFGKIGEYWWMAPDPIKLLTKLGRHDLVNEYHVEEYRRSFADLVVPFKDYNVCVEVAKGVSDRYNIEFDCTNILRMLPSLAERENFSQLFYSRPGDIIDYNRKEFHRMD